jgi:hypothetical protein
MAPALRGINRLGAFGRAAAERMTGSIFNQD